MTTTSTSAVTSAVGTAVEVSVGADDDEQLLTTAEVAALTRAPASTVRYWRHLGYGPRGFRLGRRVLYRRGEVVRWLAEQEAADTRLG